MNEEQNKKQLPKDWKWVKLGEACEIVSGNTPKGLELISNTGEYQFYKVSDMNLVGNEIRMNVSNLKMTLEEIKKLKVKVYPKGTVIFPKRGGAILTNKKRVLSQDASFDLNVMGILPNDKLSSNYLFYWIQKLDLSKIYDGSNVPQINNKNVAPLDFPLPPKPTQQAIVSKIEELFSELDKGIENLRTAQQQLKTYRQSVLKWAFEGKLTNENVKDGELPEGWKWKKISDLGRIETGTTPSKSNPDFYGDEYPFYKPTDLEAGENVFISRDGLTKIGVKAARYVPENSTLVTCIGATIGKTGLIKRGGGFNQQINAIVPNENMNPKFIYYQTIGLYFQKQIVDNASATTLPIINKSKFQILEMTVCSIEEQNKIVQEIESRLSVSDKMEESITKSLQQAEALRQSILKKAFEGGLVK